MRILKVLLTGLFAAFALLVGLFVAAFSVLALALGRLLGGSGRIRVRTHVGGTPRRPSTMDSRDVIDVTATEVRADSLPK
jgi:hypothetical protein